jgi:hypothetical protein
MAPEQGSDPSADIRADLYSLGCTLYHLLAGQVPFPGGSLLKKLARHQNEQPEPLSRLRPDVPAGMVAVVEKMMAKAPARRYQSPAEAASALAPFCLEAPTTAWTLGQASTVSASSTQRLPGSARRWWWLAAAGVAGLLVVVGLFVGGALFWMGRTPAGKGQPSVPVVAQLLGLPRVAGPPAVRIWLNDRALSWEELRRPIELPAGEYELVLKRDGEVIERRTFVVRPEHDRGTLVLPEPDAPVGEVRRFVGHTKPVFSVAFSGDGTRLLSTGLGTDKGNNPYGEVLLWDVDGPQPRRRLLPRRYVKAVALSADGRQALCGTFNSRVGTVSVFDLEDGKEVRRFEGHRATPQSVAYSPDGTRGLSADLGTGLARLWTVADVKEVRAFPGHLACFSPDGGRVLTAELEVLTLWGAASGKEVRRFKGTSGRVTSVAFAPDGRHALTAGAGMAPAPGRSSAPRSRPTATASSPRDRTAWSGYGTRPAARSCTSFRATGRRCGAWCSRPAAGGPPPAGSTRWSACGRCPDESHGDVTTRSRRAFEGEVVQVPARRPGPDTAAGVGR